MACLMNDIIMRNVIYEKRPEETKVRRDAGRPKGDRDQFAASLDLWITD